MTEQDAVESNSALQNHMNSSQIPNNESGPEAMGALRRSDFPQVAATEHFSMRPSGPCAPYYAHGHVGYADYPDRYSVGYQRMGPTITLTSHKIQFGCQSNSHSGFPNSQRCGGPSIRHQYHMIPSVGKPWMDSCSERSQNNAKSNNRGRTTYSDDQIAELESVFNTNPYPTSQTRQRLAYKIDVPEGKVKIWFQNRRARAKKSKLTCTVPWRTSIGDTGATDDRANHNNNNAKEMASKLNTSDSAIPISSILPLPTKTSITNSGLVSCMPAWRGYFESSNRNPSCSRGYHQNSMCSSMHGPCTCNELSTPYPIRMGLDRFVSGTSLPISMPNQMCRENSSNGLCSPPPIRRLIYPFHTLTDANKTGQYSLAGQESGCSSMPIYASNNSVDTSSLHSHLYVKSAAPVVSTQSTYSELRQCTSADWDSRQDTSGALNFSKPLGNEMESDYRPHLITDSAASRADDHLQDNAIVENYHGATLMNCLKTENGMENMKPSLSLGESDHANQVWNNRDSTDILFRAMKYSESGVKNLEKPSSSGQQPTVEVNASAVRNNELSAIWPTSFSGSVCPSATPSIVG